LLGREFARELADAGARALVGATHAAGSYRFFEEGLATWVADRCAVSRGPAAPHWLWAAYAHVEEATYLEYLAAFERAADEM
ncbi:MAG: hypothetical protein GWO39_08415, partial [Gammaproteobacteria bacterium]|nr:hypothetical protein [Gammaproteobacteria bacterium]NIU53634.1 hypothetical protein [Gemmatimonadota bacterium]NIR97124.1 hypothetical protein [Gammaproteobacteria bacterium]NIT63796.1 hypothetical protein [Gammaproteobacteria bacterium]NIV20751.1 hypothetical protein [Gammaproteobacteria bacterium]